MKKHLGLILLMAVMMGCQKKGSTPEDAFKMFSLATQMGQPPGMERYGEKEYAKSLVDQFDLLALLSAFWPKDVMVLKSETSNGIATLEVQGINAAGKTVQGTFKLRQHGDVWKVFEGGWKNLSGQESEATLPTQESTSGQPGEFQPAVPEYATEP